MFFVVRDALRTTRSEVKALSYPGVRTEFPLPPTGN
jgi:hypothetical protein